MCAVDRNAILDSAWIERCKRIGRAWMVIDNRVDERMEKDEMDSFKVSFKKRGGGWLVIMDGTIAGQKKVMFKDVPDLSGAGDMVKSMLEDPAWKDSKPFDPIKTKPNTDRLPGL